MATRATVLLKDANGNKLTLYRHYDGYPAATGADLARKLKKMSKHANSYYRGWAAFANMLLSEFYEQQPYEKKPKQVYEITEHEHGDLDYQYAVIWNNDGNVVIHVWESRWVGSERKWQKHSFFEEGLREYVKLELLDMRKRIQRSKAA